MEKRAIDTLRVLADALEEASCTNAAFLAFCRSGIAFPGRLDPDLANFVDLTARWQAFQDTYAVRVLSDHEVSFTLPEGKSRMDLLNDSQALGRSLYDRVGVEEAELARWGQAPRFTTPVAPGTTRSVNGQVPTSNDMNYFEQVREGWNDVDIEDLVAAHQAYWIATGKDLFLNDYARALGEHTLGFYSFGLSVNDFNGRSGMIWASRLLPSPG